MVSPGIAEMVTRGHEARRPSESLEPCPVAAAQRVSLGLERKSGCQRRAGHTGCVGLLDLCGEGSGQKLTFEFTVFSFKLFAPKHTF